jgi:hypothetical protein
MHFLDVLVYAREGRLATCIYRMELNEYLYIPFSSAHPIAVKKAFIKAGRSRIRSNYAATTLTAATTYIASVASASPRMRPLHCLERDSRLP